MANSRWTTSGAAALLAAVLLSGFGKLQAEEKTLHTFKRHELTDTYFSEGANAGDINGDGKTDLVYGPYWFEGPDFKQKHEIYKPKPQNVNAYSNNNFFTWIYDFNGDGANDLLVVGIPGRPAIVYENPGKDGLQNHWKQHEVLDSVTNESPQFVNVVGDERPELVCTNNRFYGYATINWDKPFAPWKFHGVSDPSAPERFGHGLGVGDLNKDGRPDIMQAGGWYEQPAENADGRWKFHEVKFTNSYGGADMFAYDVDGDGDNDVITSLAAHDFGLAWFEQVQEDGKTRFKMHVIMDKEPGQNRYGLNFTELHAVALEDIDGDGLKDIVTGKTYWSHHRKSPQWDAGAVVYWFKLVRGEDGIDWVPYKADSDSGIGRHLNVIDVNGDGLLDIVVGGIKGGNVLLHQKETVGQATWNADQPKRYEKPADEVISEESPTEAKSAK
jgi:hypothetical protein